MQGVFAAVVQFAQEISQGKLITMTYLNPHCIAAVDELQPIITVNVAKLCVIYPVSKG